jgi:hypothetical protein
MNAPASHAPPAFLQLERLVLSMPMAQTLGLKFTRIAPGDVEVEIPVLDAFTFRPGQLQATPGVRHRRLRGRGRRRHDPAAGLDQRDGVTCPLPPYQSKVEVRVQG